MALPPPTGIGSDATQSALLAVSISVLISAKIASYAAFKPAASVLS